MMSTDEFYKIRQQVLEQPICYKEVEAKEIVAMGENHYRIGNVVFEVRPDIAKTIDHFAGIKSGQTRIAFDSYGEQGVINLRNFFGQAEAKNNKHLILAANTDTKEIVEAILVKNKMITPAVFFDFAEMFMDKNQYLPEQVEYIQESRNGVSILMKPYKEELMEYAPGDEFMANGLYLKWTPSEINIGNYYRRLVCENGSTQLSQHSITQAFSPDIADLERLLNITALSGPLKSNTDLMLANARIAMRTTASVRELGVAVKMLNVHDVTPEEANRIIPYNQIKELYKKAGYPTNSEQLAQAKSDRTMWELFNTLTHFSTHNKIWPRHDIRRTSLMEASMTLLNRQRDIKEYFSIF